MTLAADYPLLDIFWTMVWFFLFVVWLWAVFAVITDLFRSPDLSGVSKAIWFVVIILMPVLGVFIYLIARGGKMAEHAVHQAQVQDAAFREYVQTVTTESGSSTADQLTKLADLRDRGVLSAAEYEAQKAKVLA
jgi:hypothetical protein